MRRHDDFSGGRVQGKLVDRDRRQVVVDLRPRRAAVGRGERAELSADEQQGRVLDVLPQHARRAEFRQVRVERFPGLAEVLGHVDERSVVVGAMPVEGDVAATIGSARCLDGGHPARSRQADAVGHVLPFLTAVARHPQGAIVGAGPEDVGIAR